LEAQVATQEGKDSEQLKLLTELSHEDRVYEDRLKDGLYVYQQLCFILVAVPLLLGSEHEQCAFLEHVLKRCEIEKISFLEIIGTYVRVTCLHVKVVSRNGLYIDRYLYIYIYIYI
jgi:hypothetical protein